MRDRTAKVALLIVSIVVALYALEIGLIIVGRRAPAPDITPQEEFGDGRQLLDVVRDLRDEGVDAHPISLPRPFLDYAKTIGEDPAITPLGSISNVTTVLCKRLDNGAYVVYESDPHGFNNPQEAWSVPNLEMALIGDSFALGYCVEREESLAGQLRELGHTTLSFGMGMNGPLIALASLVEYGTALRPRAVLWLYYEGNDLRNLLREREYDVLLAYMNNGFSQDLVRRQGEIDRMLLDNEAERIAARKEEARQIMALADAEVGAAVSTPRRESGTWARLASIATLARLRSRLGPRVRRSSRSIASPELASDVLARAQEVVEEWDGRLVFVYLTHRNRYIPGGNIKVDQLRQRETVLSLVGELGIPIIDTEDAFSSHPDPESLFEPMNRVREADGTPRRGIHYSPDGYRVIAEAIGTHLYSEGRP